MGSQEPPSESDGNQKVKKLYIERKKRREMFLKEVVQKRKIH